MKCLLNLHENISGESSFQIYLYFPTKRNHETRFAIAILRGWKFECGLNVVKK